MLYDLDEDKLRNTAWLPISACCKELNILNYNVTSDLNSVIW